MTRRMQSSTRSRVSAISWRLICRNFKSAERMLRLACFSLLETFCESADHEVAKDVLSPNRSHTVETRGFSELISVAHLRGTASTSRHDFKAHRIQGEEMIVKDSTTNTKGFALSRLMEQVSQCRRCCEPHQGIDPEKLLHNFIAERPNAPHYGGVPNLWTDWNARLDAKIAVVGQDWGAEGGELGTTNLRRQYEEHIINTDDPEKTWRNMRAPLGLDRNRMAKFFQESAGREGLPPLPSRFRDYLFLTNSVLCVRRGQAYSGDANFDGRRCAVNCHDFLLEQLRIVRPAVVITLGSLPLWSLVRSTTGSLRAELERVHGTPPGYIEATVVGLNIAIVPVFHHAARPINRSEEQQIEDYRFLWRALRDRLQIGGQELIESCFSEEQT
jgi:uracil-DNA glycosylase